MYKFLIIHSEWEDLMGRNDNEGAIDLVFLLSFLLMMD